MMQKELLAFKELLELLLISSFSILIIVGGIFLVYCFCMGGEI